MAKHLDDMVQTKHNRKEATGKNEIPEEVKINYVKSRSRYMLWSVALISVVFCFFAFSFMFSKAEIVVNPKTKDVVLNENLSASKDASDDGLFFDLVVISGEENKIIKANKEKEVQEVATGTVVIYNAFSSSSQRLNADTRLEGSNGKIYKTQTKVVLPGMSKDNTPGSTEVVVYGEDAGIEYNSAPLDFKIVGFKGTLRYTKIYARSKGSITGGFIGSAPDISDAEKATATSELKEILKTKLLQKAIGQIPNGFILFKDAVFLSTDDKNILSTYNKDNSMTLTLKGTLNGLLFDEQKLTKKISEDNIEKYDGSEVYIQNIRDLVFSVSNKDAPFDNLKNIDFNLSGTVKIVWKLNVSKFTALILGKSKNDFNQILSQYGNVDSATLNLSPFWKMSIPDQTKNVKVTVNYPN